jgi:urease accessory protein
MMSGLAGMPVEKEHAMTAALPIFEHQRSHGEARVTLDLLDGRVKIGTLRQRGSAKVMLPHVGRVPEVVFLNTSGGLTGGDRLSYSLSTGAGLHVVATTQTAERAYQASAGIARVQVALEVGAGGWLDWLPQETILFDGSALQRNTRIDLGRGAGCIVLEQVVLGRAAMGETLRHLQFRDQREIWREGRLVTLEPLCLNDASLGAGSAVTGGARAFASLVMIGGGAEDALGAVRAAFTEDGVEAGASRLDGRLHLRLATHDGWPLRQQIIKILRVLRTAALPRVWQI